MSKEVPSRESVIKFLKQHSVPVLRERGFMGSFPHFRRPQSDRIDLLTFQFDKWGGGFVIEIAVSPPEGVTTHWGKQIAPSKVTAHNLSPYGRLRLGADSTRTDSWFRYDQPDSDLGLIVQRIRELLDSQAEPWWNAWIGHRPSS